MVWVIILRIDVKKSEKGRARGVMVSSSPGSATACGDELTVAPAAMAVGDPVCVVPVQGLSFLFVDHDNVNTSVCFGICFIATC